MANAQRHSAKIANQTLFLVRNQAWRGRVTVFIFLNVLTIPSLLRKMIVKLRIPTALLAVLPILPYALFAKATMS